MVRQQLVHSKMTVLNVEVEHDWASWVDAEFIDERNIEPTTLTELRCQHDDTSSCKIPMNIEPTTLNELRCKHDDASSCVFPMNIRFEELSEVVNAHAHNDEEEGKEKTKEEGGKEKRTEERTATVYKCSQSTCPTYIGKREEEESGKALYEGRHPENGPRGMPIIDHPRPSTSYEGRSMWF